MGRVDWGAGTVTASPAASSGGGRVNWATAGTSPQQRATLQAKPIPTANISLSPQDQHLVASFKTLDTPTRTKLLTNFQAQAKAGNVEAGHKLNLLMPSYKSPVPQTPNYQDTSLAGRIYQVEQAAKPIIGKGAAALVTGFRQQLQPESQIGTVPNINKGLQVATSNLTPTNNTAGETVNRAAGKPVLTKAGHLTSNLEAGLNAALPGATELGFKAGGKLLAKAAVSRMAAQAAKHTPEFQSVLRNFAQDQGLAHIPGPPKTAARISQKAASDYGGDLSQVRDSVRGSLAVPDTSKMGDIIKQLGQKYEVTRVKNGLSNEGYQDVKVNVKLPNGKEGEIKLATPEMLRASEAGHGLYEQLRVPGLSPEARDAKQAELDQVFAEARRASDKRLNSASETLRPNDMALSGGQGLPRSLNATRSLEPDSYPTATGTSSTSKNLGSLRLNGDGIAAPSKESIPQINVNGKPHDLVEANKLTSYEGAPDRAQVEKYKQQILSGKPVEPLKVLKDSKGNLGVEDGKHRLQAMQELGIKRVPVQAEAPTDSRLLHWGGGTYDAARVSDRGISLSKDSSVAKAFANNFNATTGSNKGAITSFSIDPNAKILHLGQVPSEVIQKPGQDFSNVLKYAREQGYDAVDLSKDKSAVVDFGKKHEQEIRVLNSRVLRGATQPSNAIQQDVLQTLGEDSTKKQGQILRQAYSGAKNEQTVQGNQLSDQIKHLAPKEQKAIFWYREAGGDVNKLKAWAADTNKALDPHRADIEAAMNLSDKAKQASQLLDAQYKKIGQQGLETGALRSVRNDYANSRLYKQETPPSIKTETGTTLKTSTSHAKQRVYDTMYDAISNGKVPATTNAADLMSIHNEELARVNASRTLYDAMEQNQMGGWFKGDRDVPPGYSIVDRRFDQVFAAPEPIAKQLKPLVDPGFLNKIDAYRKLGQYQGLVKTVDLSFSLFHHVTETAQALYQVSTHPLATVRAIMKLGSEKSPEFNQLEQDFVKHTGITSKVHANLDTLMDLKNTGGLGEKLSNLPGFKQVRGAVEKNNEFLFDHMQRYLKVMDYGQKTARWVTKHPNATDREVIAAKRGFAKEVNSAYGGLNWEAMGVSRTAQQGMRAIFLAPDWLVSNLSLGKMALTEGGTAGNAARANLATAFLGSLALTEMANKAITGHYTNQNPKAHQLEVEIAPHVYISLFRGAIGELVKLGSNIADNGPLEGVARYAQSKGSPIERTTLGLLSNTNYYGQQLTSAQNSFAKNTGAQLSFTAQNILPAPFGAVGAYKYGTSNEKTLPGMLAVASGVGRYSAPGGAQQRFESESPEVQKLLTKVGYSATQPKQVQRGQQLSKQQYAALVKQTNDKFNAMVGSAIKDGYLTGMSSTDAKKKIATFEAIATKQALDSILGKAPKPSKSSSGPLKKYTSVGAGTN